MTPRTYIDLFCGCGGFSLGMQRAGFHELVAIDFYPEAISTFRANFPHLRTDQIIQADLTKFGPEQLDAILMPRTRGQPVRLWTSSLEDRRVRESVLCAVWMEATMATGLLRMSGAISTSSSSPSWRITSHESL